MNPTASAFDSQEYLSGIADIPRITTGYLPNADHTEYSLFLLHTKTHWQNNWIFSIDAEPNITQLDLPDEQSPDTTRRVQPRGFTPPPAHDESAASS